jgi:hypothetical protein
VKVIIDSQTETKGTIYNKSTLMVAYVYDIVTVWRSIDALKETVKKLIKAAQIIGLACRRQNTWQ